MNYYSDVSLKSAPNITFYTQTHSQDNYDSEKKLKNYVLSPLTELIKGDNISNICRNSSAVVLN